MGCLACFDGCASLPSFTPTYDPNGNLTKDPQHQYSWDSEGRPVTIDTVTLTYDALGRMAEQNKSGVYSQIVYTPLGSKFAIMNGSTLTKAFVALTGGSQAVYTSSGLAYYRHSDWIGSSRFASTPTRTLYYDGAYAPFGEAYPQTGTADLSFTGMNQDTVANLYDFPAREYNDIHGRWPSPDPAGISAVRLRNPQTWNRYAYVNNSPLNHIDPLGMEDISPECDDETCGGDGGSLGDGGGGDGSTIQDICPGGVCPTPSPNIPTNPSPDPGDPPDLCGNGCLPAGTAPGINPVDLAPIYSMDFSLNVSTDVCPCLPAAVSQVGSMLSNTDKNILLIGGGAVGTGATVYFLPGLVTLVIENPVPAAVCAEGALSATPGTYPNGYGGLGMGCAAVATGGVNLYNDLDDNN